MSRAGAWLLAASLVLVSASPRAHAATYSIVADQDSWLKQSSPTETNGDHADLHVKSASGDSMEAVLHFDLSAIPAGTLVANATLWLSVKDKDDSGQPIQIYRMNKPWGESGVSWQNRSHSYDASSVHGAFTPDQTGPISADISDLVRAWLAGIQTNDGLMLIATSSNKESKYRSRETSQATERPVLVINTTDQADLEMSMTATTVSPGVGDTVSFLLRLDNHGPDAATGVIAADPLPAGLTYRAHSSSQGSYNSFTGSWTVGTVSRGAFAALAIDATVDAGTLGNTLNNRAWVVSLAQSDPDTSNNSASRSVTVTGPVSIALGASAYDQSGGAVGPGAAPIEMLRIKLVNHSAVAETLASFQVANRTSGPGAVVQLDASWTPLTLWVDPAGPSPETFKTSASLSGGVASFTNLAVRIPASDSVDLVVRGAASLVARDGDVLDLEVSSPASFNFSSSVAPSGPWPLDPPGSFPVNGMTAAQITVDPAGPGSILGGSRRNLVMGFRVPANGYQADVLTRLDVVNLGSAVPGADIERLEAWADDGDGAFDPGMDRLLGELPFTGGRWQRTGLNEPVPAQGMRILLTADIFELANEGRSVLLALPSSPDVALGMTSNNDGPVDAAVVSAATQTITASDRVSFLAVSITSTTVAPGQQDVPMLDLLATNLYSVTKTLNALTVKNVTLGPGSGAQLDAELDQVFLRADANGDGALDAGDPVIGASHFAGGSASFTGLAWTLAPAATGHLFVTARISLNGAADGDVLGLQVEQTSALTFADGTAVAADWPLDSGARRTVDGMLAAQISNLGAPVATLGPSEGPVLALDLVVPANGYAADVLRGVRLLNLGTAVPADLAVMGLWQDGGNGTFDGGTGDDTSLGSMNFLGGHWTSPVLGLPVSGSGTRLFTSVTVAPTPTDSAAIRLGVALDGITMDSGNDGPRDFVVANSNSILLSNSTLLSTLQLTPDASTLGQSVTGTLLVRNIGAAAVTGITPSILQREGTGVLAVLSGPSPASMALAAGGQGTFTWTLRADSTGDVRMRAGVSGIESGSGLPRRSLQSPSNTHQIFVQAGDLDLFAVNSMPVSVNLGQPAVVALNLTFTHPGGAAFSGVRLRGLRMRLEDAGGNGIVPSDVLSRVVVSEGSTVYLNKTAMETSGAEVTLMFAQPVLIEAGSGGGNQVTLSLALDILGSTSVPTLRVAIGDGGWFTAEDATSGAPVSATLLGGSFPIRSGVARVRADATQLDVTALAAPAREVGQGQTAVTLIPLQLLNPDPTGLAADVRVSSFRVSLVDSIGQAIADPWRWLGAIRVRGSLQQFLSRAVTPADSDALTLLLSPVVSAPANIALPLWIEADLADSASFGSFRLRVAEETWFDARDANTSTPVTVYYPSPPLEGPLLTVRAPADSLHARRLGGIAATVTVGQTGVSALRFRIAHPGGAHMGLIRVDTLAIECRDEAQNPVPAADRVSVVRVYRGGMLIGTLLSPPPIGSVLSVSLAGLTLPPGSSDTLHVVVDIAPTAPASFLELRVERTGIRARDENLGEPVAVAPEWGASLPLSSGIARLAPPPRELLAGLESVMPAVLAADGRTVAAARLALTNVAVGASGDIRVAGLRVRASDRDGREILLGAAATHLVALVADTVWAQSGTLALGDTAAMLVAADTLAVRPGAPAVIELRFVSRPGTDVVSLRLGCAATDIGVQQPGSALLAVAVQPASGQSFPLWTGAGSFSSASLAESYANFPNPFAAGREQTSFAFYLPVDAHVTLRVFTPHGHRVRTVLEDVPYAAGMHQDAAWDGRNGHGDAVANGVYAAELLVRYADGRAERTLRKVAVVR